MDNSWTFVLKNKSIRSGMCQNFRLSTGKEIEFKAAPFCHFNRSHGRVVGVVFHQECLVFNDEAVVYDKGKGIAERQYYLCGQPNGFLGFGRNAVQPHKNIEGGLVVLINRLSDDELQLVVILLFPIDPFSVFHRCKDMGFSENQNNKTVKSSLSSYNFVILPPKTIMV